MMSQHLQLTSPDRNFGIMLALMVFGCAVYLIATEYISGKPPTGEVLLFQRRRSHHPQPHSDEEANSVEEFSTTLAAEGKGASDVPFGIHQQTAVIHWEDVNFDLKVKGKERRLLHNVDGWVRPGTLTALMVRFLVATMTQHLTDDDDLTVGCIRSR